MAFVPLKVLLSIDTEPPASIVAPSSRFSFARTLSRETEPSVIISRPIICRRAVSGLLKLLFATLTSRTARMIAPAVLLRSNFELLIFTSLPAFSSAPAPLVEFVTVTFDKLMLFCEFRTIPVPLGFVIEILLSVSEPPHGLVLVPTMMDTLLNELVLVVVPVDVSQPPVMVRSELLILLRLKLLKLMVDSPP